MRGPAASPAYHLAVHVPIIQPGVSVKRITRFDGNAAVYFYSQPFYDKTMYRHYPPEYIGKKYGTIKAVAQFIRDLRKTNILRRDPEQVQSLFVYYQEVNGKRQVRP